MNDLYGKKNMKEIAAIILLLGLAVGNEPLEAAVLPDAVTPAEMARLPPYCPASMTTPQDSPEARAWRGRIGENFIDFFHYCMGLNYVNRYWAASSEIERNYYLQRAKAQFDYIEKPLKPDFTMGADLHVTTNSPARALETVTEGLCHVPDSKALQRRYLELGGKKPFPEPIATKSVDPESPLPGVLTPAPETTNEPVPALSPSPETKPVAP
jgi:hypothetical protein